MSVKPLSKEDSLHIVLDSIYCLHRVGDHTAANELLIESKNQIEGSKTHLVLSELLMLIGKYHQNQLTIEDIEKIKTSLKGPVENLQILLYQGWLHFLLGFHLKSESDLSKAVHYFHQGEHLEELYETYYWMDRFRVLPQNEKIQSFVRLYPIKRIYSKILGNTFYEDKLKPLTQVERIQAQCWIQDEEESFDCWIISEKNIIPANYRSIDTKEDNFLDLYSGLIKDRGVYIFLLLSELNCLSYLIAAEYIGATLAQIAEFLERTEKETETLIKDIQKMGIPLKIKNKAYFLDWENKPNIIIPRNLKVKGLHEFVRKEAPVFSRSQLIELLQITQFGADALMKKWSLAGFIRPVERNETENIWKFF
jgi:hypothetical protein